MRTLVGMVAHYVLQIEIDSLAQWDDRAQNTTSAHGWIIQDVDLTERSDDLHRLDVSGALFLGCQLPDDIESDLKERGAIVFPKLPGLPFNPYRANLYKPTELYDGVVEGRSYADSTDALVYGWLRTLPHLLPLRASLAMTLHDHAISDALDEACQSFDPKNTFGIMGGHAVERNSDAYIGSARLASMLASNNNLVLTGGGPGAMEAANLGAFLANRPAALRSALDHLGLAKDYVGQETYWSALALEIRQTLNPSGTSIGVPTWYYGHEPANVFGTGIAKYFSNALREDALITHCKGGIVYLSGAAGTTEEMFQTVTKNYYAASEELISPMVLVDKEYWTRQLPAWQLLSSLAKGKPMENKIFLVDEVDEAAELLLSMESR